MPRPLTGALLLVEDDAATRRMFEYALTSAGFTVHTATNGAEALTHLKTRGFDLVVLDSMLPCITGLGVLSSMRQDEATAQLPVIVVTGAVLTREDVEQLRGAILLRKPVLVEELVDAVNLALYGHL